MKYSNAIGAALNGLFRSTIAQPQQNGVLDGLKIAQGESTINQNNASIAKNNAEATRLNDERLLYSDDALRGAISSALTGGNEADRTNALLRITPLVKNPEQVTDAIGKSFRQLYAQNVMNGLPNAAENLNTLSAAEKGNMYSDVGTTGLVLNQGTGLQGVGNQKLFTGTMGKIGSETNENNAQANQANSTVILNNWRMNQPNNAIGYNADGGMVLVDKRTGKTTPVSGSVLSKPVQKLPPTALKMQQELVDTIGTLGTTNTRLGNIVKQIDSGKLDLSPTARASAWVRNNTNNSDENSRNISNLAATLEELRNASLRLNAGVQTDGDAQRAWNEIAANPNDTALVRDRLMFILEKNKEAAKLKKLQIEQLRQNFNQPQLGNYGDNGAIDQADQSANVFDFNDLPD
jgi:hypothetical protein